MATELKPGLTSWTYSLTPQSIVQAVGSKTFNHQPAPPWVYLLKNNHQIAISIGIRNGSVYLKMNAGNAGMRIFLWSAMDLTMNGSRIITYFGNRSWFYGIDRKAVPTIDNFKFKCALIFCACVPSIDFIPVRPFASLQSNDLTSSFCIHTSAFAPSMASPLATSGNRKITPCFCARIDETATR